MVKKTYRVFCLLIASQLLLACSSITFVQFEQEGEQAVERRWHHSTLNGMVEISRPLNISKVCGATTWTQITTEFTWQNFLVSSIVPSSAFVSIYSPWTNKIECFVPEANDMP
ncbi:MAG: hypothetical protein AB8B48_00080 [Pseudomonadales bacterium]